MATVHRDAFGRVIEVIDPLGAVRHMTYTVEGQPLSQTDPVGGTQSWTWDAEGNCLRHTDEKGGVTRFEYGAFDLPTVQVDADGARYSFERDTELQLISVSNPQGLTWDYAYDAAGRLISESDFDDREITYHLDAAGQLIARTNALGQTVTYGRDPLGNIESKQSDGQVTTYTYDPTGQLVSATGPDCELTIERDPLGRVLAETVNGRVLRHSYDALGRPLTRTTPSGQISALNYDMSGHLASLDIAGRAVLFERDAVGQEIGRRMAPGIDLQQTWDAAGRLAEQRLTAHGRGLRSRSYTYRSDHFVTTVNDDVSGPTSFALDLAGRVTAVSARGWSESYVYDAAGNQTAADWPDRSSSDTLGERSYTGTRISRAGRVRFEHDSAGRVALRQIKNLSKRPSTWRYVWDSEDRLREVTTPDGTVWRYHYDPLGRRIEKQRLDENGDVAESTVFTWHDNTLVEQTTDTGSATARTMTWDYDGLHPITQTESVAQSEIDRRFYAIVTDLVGTPTELVDETGRIAWQSRTSLWGTAAAEGGTGPHTPLRFPGQYADPETGWHYNLHRHYDPHTARYTSPDPLGLAPGPNHYAYVPNPHTWVDPLGLSAHPGLREGYTSSPALRGDPYHPDSVAARSAENRQAYGPSVSDRARDLGYTRRIPPQRAPFHSHGQPVFSNGRNYITPDVDGHNVTDGWKMFDRRGERLGTYDADLNYVKE
ncbi:RHS repeat-associated core domain-containing protein [Streptomyces specialis]|uniref:RHS repeat-associated core domain-containing protein n=1 Tax=Streptomyces specialis TaxID=498367 RepID=UPI00073F9485|nr:RHS repeat-associated core domain-containing protein [Streptomyces specialis]